MNLNARLESLRSKDFIIVIQARMTSTRLPKKVMLPLRGKTVLETMLDRLSPFKDKIVIATTNDGSQSPIVELCQQLDVKYVEGDTEDVLGRYMLAADSVGANEQTVVVRCTSDCPLIDPQVTADVISHFFEIREHFDYVSAGPHCGYPNGFDTEVFTYSALLEAHNNATADFEREHVTQYISKNLRVADYSYHQDLSDWRLTLDEVDDYKLINEIYALFDNRVDFTFAELQQKIHSTPGLLEINQHVEQKQVG
ncbi:cytidylyltransferase domain-containing protein [Pseudoalteromonas sp. T1lg65]|uniref:cytidylyltransferase domain-containing protein n=1 Tax=Pseudoalteromonas sp. T1lg65 TaxID=2077101 RepID=UPI003F7B1B0B